MDMSYRIYRDKRVVGNAELIPDGLYYQVHCRCKGEAGAVVRIVAWCDAGRENIGICLPNGDWMEIRTRIARKKLQNIKFFEAATSANDGHWFPLAVGEPISCLNAVIRARLEERDGRSGLVICTCRPDKDL